MKAGIFEGPGKISIKEMPKPQIQKDTDAVIRVLRACVCGSDLWWFRGISDRPKGSTTGHEAIGIVDEVGSKVKDIKKAILSLCLLRTVMALAAFARPVLTVIVPMDRKAGLATKLNTCVMKTQIGAWSKSLGNRRIILMPN